MDIRNGRIYKSIQDIPEGDLKYCMEMAVQPNKRQILTGKVGRNDKCPCGSDKKFKKCCHKDFQDDIPKKEYE